MGRRVKCVITGEYGNSDTFFKAENNKYYKDKTTYDDYLFQMDLRYKIIDDFSRLLGYYDTSQFNTQAMKELKSLSNTYSYKDIYDTFKEYYSRLEVVLPSKANMTDYQKAKYIFSVIKNNINDFVNKNKHKLDTENSIEKKDVELDILNDIQTNTAKAKDISSFLDY